MSDDIDLGLMMVEVIPHEDAVTILLGVGQSCVTVTWKPDVIAADESEAGALISVVSNLTKVLNHVMAMRGGDEVGPMLDLRTGA